MEKKIEVPDSWTDVLTIYKTKTSQVQNVQIQKELAMTIHQLVHHWSLQLLDRYEPWNLVQKSGSFLLFREIFCHLWWIGT